MNAEWPKRPEAWPPILTDVEAAQYLRLDTVHGIDSAKRSLRHIRKTQGLPCAGRIGGRLLFRRDAIDLWLMTRENNVKEG